MHWVLSLILVPQVSLHSLCHSPLSTGVMSLVALNTAGYKHCIFGPSFYGPAYLLVKYNEEWPLGPLSQLLKYRNLSRNFLDFRYIDNEELCRF